MSDDLSRAGLRHQVMRRRNERIFELRDESMPLVIWMSTDTRDAILIDDDPAEARVVDFEGRLFMGIPIQLDGRLEYGVVELQWPSAREVAG